MKRRALIVLLGAFAACSSARVAQVSEATWEQEVRAAEERHRRAFLANDVVVLDELFAEDFVVNSPLNRVVDRQQLLDLVRAGRLTLSAFEQRIETVRRYGDVAVVMGADAATFAAPAPNAGTTQNRRFTDLWRFDGRRWLFTARQASIVCP